MSLRLLAMASLILIVFSCVASQPKKYWDHWSHTQNGRTPSDSQYAQMFEELSTKLPMYVDTSNTQALSELGNCWVSLKLNSCNGQGFYFQRRLVEIYCGCKNQKNASAIKLLAPLMLRTKSYNNPNYDSPIDVFEQPVAFGTMDKQKRETALWELETLSNNAKVMNFFFNSWRRVSYAEKNALGHLPAPVQRTIVQQVIAHNVDKCLKEGDGMNCIKAMTEARYDAYFQGYAQRSIEHEICIAECAADERRFAALESASASAPFDTNVTE